MDCNNCDKKLAGEKTEVAKTSWATVELMADAHRRTVRWMGAFIVLLIAALISVTVYHNWKWSTYDVVDIAQDGNGNNVIGDGNRSWYNEPTGEDSQETEQD